MMLLTDKFDFPLVLHSSLARLRRVRNQQIAYQSFNPPKSYSFSRHALAIQNVRSQFGLWFDYPNDFWL